MKITAPLKWHGGKSYLAKRIVELMPKHIHYVEPFAGGLSVLLATDPNGRSEVVNDINKRLTNFWRTLQGHCSFEAFQRIVEAMPFSETEWNGAHAYEDTDSVRDAVAFFVDCRQSLAGRMDAFAPLSKNRTRRGQNEQTAAWIGAVEGLPAVHRRLMRVAIRCRPALEVIAKEDSGNTLFYCDPPYLPDSRSTPDVYAHEMTEGDHIHLAAALNATKGKVMLSGYPSPLYAKLYRGWRTKVFELPNNAASGKSKARKQETIWMNW